MFHSVGLFLDDQYMLDVLPTGGGLSMTAMLRSSDGPSLNIPIQLPCSVLVDQSVPPVKSQSHLEARLQAAPTSSSTSSSCLSSLDHPLSAADLRKGGPSAFSCGSCDRQLVDLSSVVAQEDETAGSGFKNLPSEHWAEMVEVWMCHDDPAFTAGLAEKTKAGFWPDQSRVLVGNTYLLVHPDNASVYNCIPGSPSRSKVSVVSA